MVKVGFTSSVFVFLSFPQSVHNRVTRLRYTLVESFEQGFDAVNEFVLKLNRLLTKANSYSPENSRTTFVQCLKICFVSFTYILVNTTSS